MKHHYAGCLKPETREKFYDYLWVGENVKDLSDLTKTAKYDPYVVPCPDFKDMDMKDYERVFAHFLPLMQFPLRADGRPFNMYDKMNVPVKALDAMLIILGALIVFLFIFGNRIQLGL